MECVADENNRMAFLIDDQPGNFCAATAYFGAFDNSTATERAAIQPSSHFAKP